MAGLDVYSDEGFRGDGRQSNEIRRIRCKVGVYSQADGSAYIEQGNTKALATVYGPHEVHGQRSRMQHDRALVNCQYSMAVFSRGERKRRPRGDRRSVEMTCNLEKTFTAAILTHLYPRSQIDIFIEVLQSDGGDFSACVNSASLALIDAGIALRDVVCACTAAVVGTEAATTVVDVNNLEESTTRGATVTVAVLPKSDQIVHLELTGRLHEDRLQALLDAAVGGCHDVLDSLNGAIRSHVASLTPVSSAVD